MKKRCICGNIATIKYLGIIDICKSCRHIIVSGQEDEPTKLILKYVDDILATKNMA
jgi:hypothetical protein